MKSTRISLKVTRTDRRGYHSIKASVVHHWRPKNGRPTYDLITSFPTVRSNQIFDPETQREYWRGVESELIRLMLLGYDRHCLNRIRERIELEVIPRPRPTVKSVAASAKKADNSLKARFPILADT